MPQRINPQSIKANKSNTKSMTNEFFGFFMPAQVLRMKNLTQNEKMILAYIITMTRNKRKFYASNAYLERNFGICTATASTSIGNLEEYGYISKVGFDGRVRKFDPTSKLKLLREEFDNLKQRVLNNKRHGSNL